MVWRKKNVQTANKRAVLIFGPLKYVLFYMRFDCLDIISTKWSKSQIPYSKLKLIRKIISLKTDVSFFSTFQNIVSVKVDHPVMLGSCHHN